MPILELRRSVSKPLAGIHQLPMNEQKEILLEKHNNWKGPLMQVDAILVMGIRI